MKKTPDADTAAKQFWRNNERFADLFNAVLFQGREVIKPELLQEKEADVSTSIPYKKHYQKIKGYQDVVKNYQGAELVILGIENQMSIHYAMPLRCRLYEDLDYLKECRALTGLHKEIRDLKGSDEFLSGIKKEDRLHMSLHIVIYYGEDEWDGPETLSEMIAIPQEFRSLFQDYRMNLVSIINKENEKLLFRNESVRNLMTQLRLLYEGDWEEIYRQNAFLDQDTATLLAAVAGSENLKKVIGEKKGGIQMCTAINNLEKKFRSIGLQEGMQQGIKQGIQDGKALTFRIYQTVKQNPGGTDDSIAKLCQCSLQDVQDVRRMFHI